MSEPLLPLNFGGSEALTLEAVGAGAEMVMGALPMDGFVTTLLTFAASSLYFSTTNRTLVLRTSWSALSEVISALRATFSASRVWTLSVASLAEATATSALPLSSLTAFCASSYWVRSWVIAVFASARCSYILLPSKL